MCVFVFLTQALSSWPLSSRRTCSAWAGLTLTSEKPDNRSDVTSSWPRTCKHTLLMLCYQHTLPCVWLICPENYISHKATQLTSRKCCSKWRSCKHCSSLVRWRSQKSSNAASVSSSWPRSLRGRRKTAGRKGGGVMGRFIHAFRKNFFLYLCI